MLLAGLNLLKNPHHLWFQLVMLGWGIGLLAHGLNVYSYRWFGSQRERMIQRELERHKGMQRGGGARPAGAPFFWLVEMFFGFANRASL